MFSAIRDDFMRPVMGKVREIDFQRVKDDCKNLDFDMREAMRDAERNITLLAYRVNDFEEALQDLKDMFEA